jgi:monofunctional biosynthetic peptidoglycan transglycosylase
MIKWIKNSWLAYMVSLLAIAWLATQLFYFVQIGIWTVVDPSSTAFMRSAQWRLALSRPQQGQPQIQMQRSWVPYPQISRNLKRAIIASEDANFVNNNGVEVDAILQAWEKDQHRGKSAAGGSTISQQLARNLFLSTEKTYIRKGQELIITMMLELWMSKQRIFEIYLNSVEWGNGVYGAQAAAQHYYKTNAATLSVTQAARLAVMLPRPKFYDAHRNSAYLAQRSGVIAARMGSAELPK